MNLVTPIVPKPPHVPDAAVFDFDMFLDPSLLDDPHERARALLRDAPVVFWTPRNGGHWVVTGHEENFQASRDWENFSNELAAPEQMAKLLAMRPPGSKRVPQQKPMSIDPPEHGKYRAPLQRAFSPKEMLARTEQIRTLANSLIDAVRDQGHCDFVAAIAEPLAVQIFLKLMGLPLEKMAEFRRMIHEYLAPGMGEPTESFRRNRMVADAMTDEILARKKEPKDDLISMIWSTEIDGKPMHMDLMEDMATILFVAGLDTVINGMGFGVRHLARDRATQDALRADPARITEAVEELLRRYTFTVPTRRVAKDVQFAGRTLKAGERLVLYLPAADLDPHQFPSPEKFDMKREDNVHIAFGVGPHRCLGSHLARVELQVLYTQMLERLPAFRLDPDKPIVFRGGHIIAVDSMGIRWD